MATLTLVLEPKTIHINQPRVKVLINDNKYVAKRGFVDMARRGETLVDNSQTLNVMFCCVSCTFCPIVKQIIHWKGVSVAFCPTCQQCPQCCSNLPVRARQSQFWETWATLGASSKVTRILKEGYTLPFRTDQL